MYVGLRTRDDQEDAKLWQFLGRGVFNSIIEDAGSQSADTRIWPIAADSVVETPTSSA
jgi:hypothetical protein